MGRKERQEFRVTLTQEDWELINKVKEETGITENAKALRYAFKKTVKLLEHEPELFKKIVEEDND